MKKTYQRPCIEVVAVETKHLLFEASGVIQNKDASVTDDGFYDSI